MDNRVSVIKCDSYDVQPLEKVIENHFLSLGGVERYIARGTKVLLKVNLLMARSPEEFTTTHPAFVEALGIVLKRAGAELVIADSPGGPYSEKLLKIAYRISGFAAVAERLGATLHTGTGSAPCETKGEICRGFNFIDPFFDCDLVVSVCKLKTHSMSGFTGAVKNMFGLIPGLEKGEWHFRFPDKNNFCNALCDLCERARPALSFMDGITAMQGDGPSSGTAYQAGVTLAAVNPYALDFAVSMAAGFELSEIPISENAVRRGLCPPTVSEITLIGDALDLHGFKKPKTASMSLLKMLPKKLAAKIEERFAPKPVISRKNCVGCGICAESCPMDTIKIDDGKAVISYDKCIKCFCCQEMCPKGAVVIKKSRIFKF